MNIMDKVTIIHITEPTKIELPAISGPYARPLVKGKNQFYYVIKDGQYIVMKRFHMVEDKPYKTYKTERGAKNCAYHMNIQ